MAETVQGSGNNGGGEKGTVCAPVPFQAPGHPQGMSHMAAPKPAPCPRESPAGDGAESKQAVWNSAFPADGSADSAAPLTINRECCWVGPSCTQPGHHGCSWGQLHNTGRCAQEEPRRVSPPSPHFQS